MNITIWTASGDDSSGTWGQSFGTEREAEDCLLEAVGSDRGEYQAWADGFAGDDDGASLFDYLNKHKSDPHLDTYNLSEATIDVPTPGFLPLSSREVSWLASAARLMQACDESDDQDQPLSIDEIEAICGRLDDMLRGSLSAPDTAPEDLGDTAMVREYGPDDYARDAATDLLASLKAILAYESDQEPGGPYGEMIYSKAYAAVRKATGGEGDCEVKSNIALPAGVGCFPSAQVVKLSSRELATLLAGLRTYQDVQRDEALSFEIVDIATDGGRVQSMAAAEIDDFCERLNCGATGGEASLETAACLWEAVLDFEARAKGIGRDIAAAREALGSSGLRLHVLSWVNAVDAAWAIAKDDYDQPFDWEFVPGWILANVDWSDPHQPLLKK